MKAEEQRQRAARVAAAQKALDGEVGMRVLAAHMRKPMNAALVGAMKETAERELDAAGHRGIVVEVKLYPKAKMATLRAHAADRR